MTAWYVRRFILEDISNEKLKILEEKGKFASLEKDIDTREADIQNQLEQLFKLRAENAEKREALLKDLARIQQEREELSQKTNEITEKESQLAELKKMIRPVQNLKKPLFSARQ